MIRMTSNRGAEAIDVLSDAFYAYPVMTHCAGVKEPAYGPILRLMVEVFVESRLLRDYPVLATTNQQNELLAIAALNPPHGLPFPQELEKLYEALNRALGPDGAARLHQLSETWKRLEIQQPHYHLGMLGVRQPNQNEGHGRRLLDAVHAMSDADPESTGVGLSTEDPKNVSFYKRFGYHVIGHEQLEGIETWVFFRPDE